MGTPKLLWLDTCALIAIATNESDSRIYFKNLLETSIKKQSPIIPCLNIDSLFEIRKEETYSNFVDYFDTIPLILLNTYKVLAQAEHNATLSGQKIKFSDLAFQIFLSKQYKKDNTISSFSFKEFLSHPKMDDMKAIMQKEEQEMQLLCEEVLNKKNYLAQLKVEEEGIKLFLGKILGNQLVSIKVEQYPSLRLMRSCFQSMSENKTTLLKRNDIYDMLLCAPIPYMNAAIIESKQALRIEKAKSLIPELKQVQLFTINDLKTNQITIG